MISYRSLGGARSAGGPGAGGARWRTAPLESEVCVSSTDAEAGDPEADAADGDATDGAEADGTDAEGVVDAPVAAAVGRSSELTALASCGRFGRIHE